MVAITALHMAMVTAAMAMRPMVAMSTAPIATATVLGNRRGIIASTTIIITIRGRCFHIGPSGRNGRLKGTCRGEVPAVWLSALVRFNGHAENRKANSWPSHDGALGIDEAPPRL